MDGANRHPRPRRLHGWSLRGTHMVERSRWQARLAIHDHMSAPWPDVWFECSSLSTHCSKVRGARRFDQCRNRFCTLLYSTARPDAARETSGEVRTTSGRTPPCDLCNDVPERPRGVLKRPWCINQWIITPRPTDTAAFTMCSGRGRPVVGLPAARARGATGHRRA